MSKKEMPQNLPEKKLAIFSNRFLTVTIKKNQTRKSSFLSCSITNLYKLHLKPLINNKRMHFVVTVFC